MTSPFAQAHTLLFVVLAGPAGQYSIWPAVLQVPAGWQVVHGAASWTTCENFVNATHPSSAA